MTSKWLSLATTPILGQAPRAIQRDAAFRSDASGTPRATKVLNISYSFAILNDFVATLQMHSTDEFKIVKKWLSFSALGVRIGTRMYRSGAPGIRATQRDAAFRSDASGSCRVD